MTHLGHLVRWDIRRFRALLFVWLMVVAATAALDAIWPQLASDPRTRQLVGTIGNLLALTEVLVSAVLIAQVVQAHALVGTTAFWMTRPLPAGTLLGAKLVLLGATMIAAPVVADILVMAIYQVPTADIIGVSIQTAQLWALWIGALVTAAALTPNLAKYALLIGSALVAAIVTISVLVAVAMYRFEAGPPQGQLFLVRRRAVHVLGGPGSNARRRRHCFDARRLHGCAHRPVPHAQTRAGVGDRSHQCSGGMVRIVVLAVAVSRAGHRHAGVGRRPDDAVSDGTPPTPLRSNPLGSAIDRCTGGRRAH